jgi:hypothetical protein
MSATPTDAQESALRGLVSSGVINDEQAAAVRAAVWPPEAGGAGRVHWVVELAGYIGGGLIIGGIALVLGERWEVLTRVGKTSILAGCAIALVIAGVWIAGGPAGVRRLAAGPSTPRRRVVGALLALVSLPTVFAVAAVDPSTRTDAIGAVIGLVVSVVVLSQLSTPIGVLITGGMSVAAVTLVLDEATHPSSLLIGLCILGLGALWVAAALTLPRVVAPRWLGLAGGVALAVVGAQLPLGGQTEGWAYALTALVAIGCFVLYQVVRDLVLLIGGVAAVTIVVPEFVNDISDGAIQGAVIMLITGATLIVASGIGLWLRRAEPAPAEGSGTEGASAGIVAPGRPKLD